MLRYRGKTNVVHVTPWVAKETNLLSGQYVADVRSDIEVELVRSAPTTINARNVTRDGRHA